MTEAIQQTTAQAQQQAAVVLRPEIDQQVVTAKAYPRDLATCSAELTQLVTMDLNTAESCVFSLPRDGRAITGPSVRLAEMAVSSWGNVRAGWRVISVDEKTVTCEGVCHDLQKNVVCTATASRSIMGKRGRYSENMIQTTTMACGAVAYRNAVFKAIPAALVKGAMDAAQAKIKDEAGDYKERLGKMIAAFKPLKVTPQQICRYFSLERIEDISAHQYVTLRGIYNSMNSGESVAGDYFGAPASRTTETPQEFA